MKSPHLHQPDAMDCGTTCLAMVAKEYFFILFLGYIQ